MRVTYRVFVAIGAFMAVIGVLYWFTSYEDAGTALLAAAAVLALLTGGWLWLRGRDRETVESPPHAEAPWFPHASLWPFWIGVAAFLIANGLIVGSWFLVPGVLLLGVGLVGYAVQTRSRSPG